MAERRRSTNTYRTMAFVDYADGHGEYTEVEATGPISEAHHRRGRRLRDARLAAGLGLKAHRDRAIGLPDDFTFATLSQVQMGTTEATEAEWAALWAALGMEEPR